MISVREYYYTQWAKSPKPRGVLKFSYPHIKRRYDSNILKWCREVMGEDNVYWFWDHYHFTNAQYLTLFLLRWP